MSQACRSLDARFQEVRRYCSGPAGGAPRGVQGAKEERCSAGHFMPWSLRDEWPGLVAGAHRSRAGTDVDRGSMASAVGLGVLHNSDPTAESEHSVSDAGVICSPASCVMANPLPHEVLPITAGRRCNYYITSI